MKNDFSYNIPNAQSDDGTIEVTNPFSGKRVGSVQAADADAVEQGLSNAHEVFEERGNHLPVWERIEILRKTALKLEENVMANEHPAFRVDWMPFGGGEHSGHGTGGIPYTMADMQHKKMLVIHSP